MELSSTPKIEEYIEPRPLRIEMPQIINGKRGNGQTWSEYEHSSFDGHSDGVAASELTPEGRRYRCSAAMQLLQPAEPFPPRRPVRRGLEGPAVGDWFRALPPLWSQWQWRSAQDKGDGEFSGAVGCKGTITSKIVRRWIVIMRFLSVRSCSQDLALGFESWSEVLKDGMTRGSGVRCILFVWSEVYKGLVQ
ncbi:unnamed protein product, partial [Sphenostylis stenocarpa]